MHLRSVWHNLNFWAGRSEEGVIEMAKKSTSVLDDEILESKKAAGCIGGIFQLFDCQHLLGGKQLSEQDNGRDPSAHAPESPRISLSCNLEKNQSRRRQDNPRYSMESSRTSSSTFTSFSSLEHKSLQKEPIYTQHSFSSGRSPRNSPRTRSADVNKSSAFKEIIKESIYRDLRSGKMKEDDSTRNDVMKSIHSPRPKELSKVNDLEESLRKVFKFKSSSERFYEGHSPRFSYDGTEISKACDMMRYSEHGGHSRLSLDSREGSLKCNLTPKTNFAMKEFDRNINKRVSATLTQLQDQSSNEKNSGIVAKLMGLEPLNSATQNSIRCYDAFNKQTQIVAQERKHEKTCQSPRNIAKSPRNNPCLDSPSKFSIEETPQRVQGYVEENINQKIESVLSKVEKRLQKLPHHYSNKEIRNLKAEISENKKNGNRKLSIVNSLSTQLTPPTYRSNEASIRASNCPIVIMEPARKLDVSFTKLIKFEGHPGLRKIRTSDSRSNRKNDYFNTQTNAAQNFTERKAKCRGPHPLSKEPSERAVNNVVSPRLQQMKPDLKMKAYAMIPFYDSNKSPRQPVNSQLLDSVSPRCKLREKLNKVEDIKLQNSGEQVNVETIKANSSTEQKSLLFEQSNQSSSSVKVSAGAALESEAKHPVILKEPSAKEINIVSPRCSCPNSVPNAMLNKDGLLQSPISVSEVFKEYQNLPSDPIFTVVCPTRTILSTVNSRTASEISERKNATIQGSRDLGTTINEARLNNATMFTLEKQDQDSTIVAEIFLVCGLLQKESDLISTLEQINSDKPADFFPKSNPQKLQQKLIFDFVHEILAQKMDLSSSCGGFDHMLHSRSFSIKHLYKELCSEIKYLRSCKERNVDDNSITHKDVTWHSQAWDSIESEIPVLVLEIERLIYKDLINEVVNGVTAVALDAKKRRQRQLFAQYEI